MERREFLKSLVAVIALPLTTTLIIPTKKSISIPVDDTDDVWSGIKIQYLGKIEVEGCNKQKYLIYRYYLTKEHEGDTCYAICDIDAQLMDLAGNKEAYAESELRMMAETIQMECKERRENE